MKKWGCIKAHYGMYIIMEQHGIEVGIYVWGKKTLIMEVSSSTAPTTSFDPATVRPNEAGMMISTSKRKK